MGPRLCEIPFSEIRRHHRHPGLTIYKGEHEISINHKALGQTCGLLPVGVHSTILTTRGLRWDLSMLIRPHTSIILTCLSVANHLSLFDGMVSTSNHLVPEEPIVYIKTTEPIWWTVELRPEAFAETPRASTSNRKPSGL